MIYIYRLKWIAGIYIIPLIFMVLFPFIKTAELNGEVLGAGGMMICGFMFGLMAEGMMLMIMATLAALSGSADEKLNEHRGD